MIAETPLHINSSRDAQKNSLFHFVAMSTETSCRAKGIKVSGPMCSVRFASSEFLLNPLSQSTWIWFASAACRQKPSNHCHFDKDDVPLNLKTYFPICNVLVLFFFLTLACRHFERVAVQADKGVTAVRGERERWMRFSRGEGRSTLSFLGVCVCVMCVCVWLTTKIAWRFYINWDLRVECVPAGLYLEHSALISEKIYTVQAPRALITIQNPLEGARTRSHTRARTTSTVPDSASLFAAESHHTAARCSLLFLPLCHSALCSHSHYCMAQILYPPSPHSLSASMCTALTPCPPPSPARNIKHDSTRVSSWPEAKTNTVMWPSDVCLYWFWRKYNFWVFFVFFWTVTDGTGCARARKWTIPSPAVPSNLYARGQTALHI